MSGYLLAQRLLKRLALHVTIARGSPNRYEPRRYTIFLENAVHDGCSATALAVAAHETIHAHQHSRMGAAWLLLLSRIEPFNYWLERRAWNRAILLLVEELRPSLCELTEMYETRRLCLRADGRRALWQCGAATVVLLLAVLARTH